MNIINRKMKVAVWYNNSDIRIEEVPVPEPEDNEILIKVMACGICGSDVIEWYRLPRAPLVQGHEIGALVVEKGNGVKNFEIGNRVFVAPKVPCLQCRLCKTGHQAVCTEVKERLPGGFAQFILVPEVLVERGTYLLPDSVSYEKSTFIEPLACVVRAHKLAGVEKNQLILILGCGMSGLLHLKLALLKNCTVASADINPEKLKFASAIGSNSVFPAQKTLHEEIIKIYGRKADVVMICNSSPESIQQAWDCVAPGGVIVFFAVPEPGKQVVFPVNRFWRQEVRIITSYYCAPSDIEESIKLLSEGKIEVTELVTHRLPLEKIKEGFQLVIEGKKSIKVIIFPHS